MAFEPCGDCLDQLVRQSLTQCMGYLKGDLAAAQAGMAYLHVFESNTDEDIKLLKKTIKSFERVLSYYGGPINE